MNIVKTEVSLPLLGAEKDERLAFVLDNVLTEAECSDLIKITEEQGYEPALLNVGGGEQQLRTDVRKSERVLMFSVEKANMIWERIKDHIPKVWNTKYEKYEVVGLNERLSCLKYGPGDYFAPHQDGKFVRPDGSEESFITIQLYLNEGFEGGDTTFISICRKMGGDGENVGVVPKIGRVLVFQHDIEHEGSLLVKGTKYSIRTDVMYKAGAFAETISNSKENILNDDHIVEKRSLKRKKQCILM